MKVYDFTVPELNYFRTYCNFTDEERALFEYRAKNYECKCIHSQEIEPKSQQ